MCFCRIRGFMNQHTYNIRVEWTGNPGSGTSSYRAYSRDHEIGGPGKASTISGSSDAAFRGDGSRYNPEELLVASLSACHMLWFLHLCAESGIVVTAYEDFAHGCMTQNADGSGEFRDVVLEPKVTVADESRGPELESLHHRAHEMCFIARSVRFPIHVNSRMIAVKTL